MKKYCLLLVVIVFACFGCHSGHSLVGKWNTAKGAQSETIEFGSDSKVTASIDIKAPIPMTAIATGTYSLDKDIFSVKVTDLNIKTADASKQALIDRFMTGAIKQQQLDAINKDASGKKLTWATDDEFSVTDSAGHQQKFTRVGKSS